MAGVLRQFPYGAMPFGYCALELDVPVAAGTGGHPVIGLFDASAPHRVADQDGYFSGKWFEKIVDFLHKEAD